MSFSKQIFDLFETSAISRGLDKEFIRTLLKDIPQSNPKSVKNLFFKISIKGLDHPLEFTSNELGKIFELKGTNTRYKTSTLIFVALLLGWDWEAQMRYINNTRLKPLIDEIQNQILTPKTEIDLQLKSDCFNLKFIKNSELLRVYLNDQLSYEYILAKNVIEEYQNFMANLFKVQFVSKGRDFVTQVHNEILDEINNSIDYLIKQGQMLISSGMAKEPEEKIYPKTLREYKNSLTILKTLYSLIDNFSSRFPDLNNIDILINCNALTIKQEELNSLKLQQEDYEDKLRDVEREKESLSKDIKCPEFSTIVKNSWTEPISSLDNLLLTIDNIQGNDLVSFSIDYPFNKRIVIENKADLKTAFKDLGEIQKSAESYFSDKQVYERYFALEKSFRDLKRQLESTQGNIIQLEREVMELSLTSKYNIEEVNKQLNNIKIMASKLEIRNASNIKQYQDTVTKMITEYETIIEYLELPKRNDEYLPYEILSNIIFELRAVKSLLDEKGKNHNETSLSIKVTAEQSQLYTNVIDLFNKQMQERCKYYYKVESNKVESIELDKYDFMTKTLTTKDGQEINALYGLSGGIDSAMTVRSLASCSSETQFGTVVLVDEWGDVSEELASTVYDTLTDLEQLSFCFFVKVTQEPVANIFTIR